MMPCYLAIITGTFIVITAQQQPSISSVSFTYRHKQATPTVTIVTDTTAAMPTTAIMSNPE